MKAIARDTYGSPVLLELRDIDKPEIGDDEVLARVRAAGVNPGDWAIMSRLPYIARPVYGLRKPKNAVRGTDVVGTVEALGTGVRRLQAGEQVFGWCDGSFADNVAATEERLACRPANLTFEQAAAVSRVAEFRGPGRPQGAHRIRHAHTGHRPHLFAERNPEAIGRVGEEHARGKIAVTV